MDEPIRYEPAKAMVALAKLAKVNDCLAFLAAEGVVRPEAVLSGMRIFIKKNPCIQAHIDRQAAKESE